MTTQGVQASSPLENLLAEDRRFPPTPESAAQANARAELYLWSDADRTGFWAEQARHLLNWDTPFAQVLNWSSPPVAHWFADGRLNACYNTVDRHVEAGNGNRVALYLPLIPEAVVAMLACARTGAVHSVVFGGFSAEALRSRIADAEATVVITADGGFRRGGASALKPAVGTASPMHAPVAVGAEHPLFILYTSGTTGKPKGIFHTTGGYLTQAAYTHLNVFDLKPETDVYWYTADTGWVTGHSYVVYGPLVNGATQVISEGTPDIPHRGRWWEIVQRYGVSIPYTAPTAIRTCMKWGEEIPGQFDLSSLRVLGSVGEPINPEAWMWYRRVVGSDRTPVVDTWWQTETGAVMIAPLPGMTATKPGSAMTPLPGIAATVVDEMGEPVPNGSGDYLVLTEPWPAMLRGIWGDHQRFVDTYWSRFAGLYFAGDGAKKDADGDIWLLGRVDDVMNVSGHRLSTTEIESALVSHPMVAEAAVVGASDETTGQAVVAFVILREEYLDRVDEAGGGHRRRCRPARARHQPDRPDRQAAHDPRRRRAPQDPLRQDHAPPAAGRRRALRGGRRDDAGGLRRDGPDRRRPRRAGASTET